MKLSYTRAMVRAALAGALDDVATTRHPVFGLEVPNSVPGIPSEVLDARGTWSDPAAYDAQAKKLAEMFRKNFEKFGSTPAEIRDAGPRG
jgi:phosphoenolpyruvate carboxykinase (ATP)